MLLTPVCYRRDKITNYYRYNYFEINSNISSNGSFIRWLMTRFGDWKKEKEKKIKGIRGK